MSSNVPKLVILPIPNKTDNKKLKVAIEAFGTAIECSIKAIMIDAPDLTVSTTWISENQEHLKDIQTLYDRESLEFVAANNYDYVIPIFKESIHDETLRFVKRHAGNEEFIQFLVSQGMI